MYNYNNAAARAVNEVVKAGEAKKAEYNRKKAEIYKNVPELYALDDKLMALGAKIGLAAVSGGDINAIKEEISAIAKNRGEILKSAGLKDYEPICEKCNDTGFVGKNYCSCVKEKIKQNLISDFAAEIPVENYGFKNFNLEYYPEKYRAGVKNIFELVKNYAENFNGKESIMLMGGTGLGKTHLSLSVASEVLNKGFYVYYSPADRLFGEIEKEHFSFSGETPVLDKALSADLLIIDDMGTEFYTKYTFSAVYNVINDRLLRKKATIISTNLSVDELEDRYGARVVSRLFGEYTVKELKGDDIRAAKKLNK